MSQMGLFLEESDLWNELFNNPHMNEKNLEEVEANQHLGQLLSIEDVALVLKVPKSWVYERTRKRGPGKLPYIKLGKYVRFEEVSIKKFLETQRKSARGL